ncbi:hypothetical protein VN12_03625 [Pirellula sp. SH-Sr6A]|uniref:hypothetical protein n=1 Tax=Pirellula sp. SH-Sr6A TaxID=1632865 RepID=UPI00078EF166|nr:hypothetical protein [Pirellula sp. SH-Sr6A]AMV31182.1 hypothetical protein VN12_03625 [Pirellula sp. SH-Sr6A]
MKKVSIYAIGSWLSLLPAVAFADEGCPTQCPKDCKPESKACPCVTAEPAADQTACASDQKESAKEDETSTFLSRISKRLMDRPRFRVTLSAQISKLPDTAESKLGSGVPAVQAKWVQASEQNLADATSAPIQQPFTFSSSLSEGLDKLVDGVIECGHKICTESKCVVVEDGETPAASDENAQSATEEPILMVPAAPPAPPVTHFAGMEYAQPEDELDLILQQSGLKQMEVPVSANQFVRLLVERAHLATRLEMTEQLMTERNVALEQIHALAEKNATLVAQVAVAEVKQQLAETLHAQLAEKAEKALKLAMQNDPAAPIAEKDSKVIQDIQEDLSNIRKQIGLLRRQSPVPFAPSSLGQTIQPYRPTGNLLMIPVPQEAKYLSAEPDSTLK